MAISAQCHQCGFKYNAPDSLAGKKVRCKRCSTVFTVQVASTGGDDDWGGNLDVMEETASAMSGAGMTSAGRGGTGRQNAISPPLEDPDDIDSVLRGRGDDEMTPADALRSSLPFDYPYSKYVDTYLPPLLVALAALLITTKTFGQDDLGRVWVPILRLVLVLLLYVVIVFPLSHLGVKRGVRKQGGHMPWSPVWKSFAVFAMPYALGYMLWLAGGSVASLLLGCLVGLVVGLGALWLLYRIRFERGPEPLVYGAATFIISVIIAGSFLVGVNLTTLAVMSASESAHTFAASPIMPGLGWDSTPPPAPDTGPAQRPSPQLATRTPPGIATQPATQEATVATPPTESVTTTPPPPTPPTPNDLTGPPPVEPDQGVAVANPVATPPAPPEVDPAVPTPGVPQPPEQMFNPDAPAAVVQQPRVVERSPAVVDVSLAPVEPGFDRVLYPLNSRSVALVVRKVGEDDLLESWSTTTKPWTKIGQQKVRPEQRPGEQYAIAPDGASVARIVTWPTLSVQALSFKEGGRAITLLELDPAVAADAMLLGYSDPTHLLVGFGQAARQPTIVVRDIKAPRGGWKIELTGVETLTQNLALNPDGRLFAVAGKGPNGSGPVVSTYVLGGRFQRSYPIRRLDGRSGVEPSGITFSPDGSMIAALFENQGNALLAVWRLPTGGNFEPYQYPAGTLPANDTKEPVSALAWLGKGEAWLVHGSDLVDVKTGQILGQTGLTQVSMQQVVAPDEVHVAHAGPDGRKRLSIVKLDLSKLAGAGAGGGQP